ncbi:GNAT family N-acetyltransferase [Streptomyces sp. NHF165]|uniref:GNAT family N-acetyltransferase n=1 Tax=Streptomyces sp. NHF165 TaxID=2175864 RepID=UPI0013570992|nr:GNAT family N-acetyltransferase [Streptomyces sp. NHF165]
MTGFSFTGCTPHDRLEIADFQDSLWRGGRRANLAYLDWKYATNPHLDDRYVTLAREDGELAGMVGVFGSCWEVAGERFTLPCLTDTVVAPRHQGSSLFRMLTDEVVARLRADGVPWVLDFGDQGAGPAMLMNGWRLIGPWAQAVVTRDKPLVAERPWHELPAVRGAASGLTLHPLPDVAAETMAGLVARLPGGPGPRPVRDAAYFRWRAANPLARYFHLVAGDGPVEGYLIGHRSGVDTDDGETPTTIVDCEATSDAVFADLVETALAWLPGAQVLMWTRDLPARRVAALRALGAELDAPTGQFTRDMYLPSLMVRATGAEPPPALRGIDSPEGWNLSGVSGRAWR